MTEGDYINWLKIYNTLNESQRRWFSAQKAIEIGFGGITKVSLLTSMSRTTITKGIRELKSKEELENQIRKKGAGRKAITDLHSNILADLELLMNENTAGDPMSSLKWTCKSTRKIAEELVKKGNKISYKTVYNLLSEADYTLQGNKKTLGSCSSEDRDGQFKAINDFAKEFINSGEPVISVDAKKKEQVGNFKNNGETWRKSKKPIEVHDHDFPSLGEGVAIPYGTYDILNNKGFVNVGITADTAEFAVNSIRQWWSSVGMTAYPNASKLMICADGGGSNGSRNRLWKVNLQKFADEIGLNITVCHYPPGTSKWNKIEHRMFSFISMNWKGQPLLSYELIVNLIGNTTTKKGLKIDAQLDLNTYEKGIKVTDKELGQINMTVHSIYPKWNYSIEVTKK
ncbi:MAG: ISAzo13 family transposase [Paludibacter sp.]|nr:ISAzo13 family transposase [Paludibacter sp.]